MCSSDLSSIEQFIELLRSGGSVSEALIAADVPGPSAEFVRTTWSFIENAPVWCQASAFAFGREDLIPDMFDKVIKVSQQYGNRLETFCDYLARHIEVDGEEHTPMAMQMLADLCGDDDQKWQECVGAVTSTLTARIGLWDGITAAIAANLVGQAS